MLRLSSIQIDIWFGIASILVGSNAYFIKRLVDQLDDTQKQVYLLREQVASIETHLKDIGWKKLSY